VLLSSYTETAVLTQAAVIIDALVHGTPLPVPSPKITSPAMQGWEHGQYSQRQALALSLVSQFITVDQYLSAYRQLLSPVLVCERIVHHAGRVGGVQ